MSIEVINEVKVLDQIKMTKSKLQSMKDHLEALLRKKVRIETEIVVLQRSIKNKEKNLVFQMKQKVQSESNFPLKIEEQGEDVFLSFPESASQELVQAFDEICTLSQEIGHMVSYYDGLNPKEVI